MVNLSSGDVSEATTPATATIPAGQSSTTFVISAVDDALLDGDQSVAIEASAAGYVGASVSLNVTDFESLVVAIDAASMSESGGAATGTVTRNNSDNASPLVVNLSSTDASEATTPATVTIPAGQTSTTFAISAVDDALLDGTQSVTIQAAASGYASGSASIQVTDSELLTVSINVGSMSESGGTATGTVTRSNSDVGSPLVVNLSSNDVSEATTPATVTIPAGQASTTFAISAADDALLDGTQTATIQATASGYASGSASLQVTDAESLALSINVSSISENGGSATGTVTRSNTDRSSPLVVSLLSSDATAATTPVSVTIGAGEASATFTIAAVDDSLLDGTQSATIQATASGYASGSANLQVMDAESLTLSISVGSMSESGGSATGTVTRGNSDVGSPLMVNLSSSDASEATTPTSVTIPAGQASATFTIAAVDDSLLDGTQSATVQATASGYANGSATIQVTDAESLTLSINVGSMSESGGSATGTVTRGNSDVGSPLVVNLSSSDVSEATAPATVTIGAGQSSATFTIAAMDDSLLDGTQSATVQATASGYANGSASIQVTDAETLTLSIDAASISENGGTTTGTVTRSNTDNSSPLVVNLINGDSSEATMPASVTIGAGQFSATFAISAVDDVLLDTAQNVVVSATAIGYAGGAASLEVRDFELLTVSLASPTVPENGNPVSAVVTRGNSDVGAALVVTLSSGDVGEATTPATVTIAAGETSASFFVTPVFDGVLDGMQAVAITASANGYESEAASLQVTDAEFEYQNSRDPLDINDDSQVGPVDALTIVNILNFQGAGKAADLMAGAEGKRIYPDASGDSDLTPLDALLVINFLNFGSDSEGELAAMAAVPPVPQQLTEESFRDDGTWAAAFASVAIPPQEAAVSDDLVDLLARATHRPRRRR